jgi:hypothetical protein
MTVGLAPVFSLTDDELQVVAARMGVDDFPTVLGVRPRHGHVDALQAAFDAAARALAGRGLLCEGILAPDLAALLAALGRPDRQLAMRVVTPGGIDGIARISMVRRGALGVLARRVGNEFVLRGDEHRAGLVAATQVLIAELPRMDSARIEPVGAPLVAMTECLDETGDPTALADGIRALGAEPRAALLLGSALGSRLAFAEITYSALAGDEDRISRCPAAVAVFYTRRGRIVAAPSISPAGERWVTLKSGSDHAIAQAIGQLIELSTERWEEA